MEALLVGLASMVAIGNVLYGTLLAWGVAGGDAESSWMRGLLALGLFASLIWTAVVGFIALEPGQRIVVAGALVLVAGIGVYLIATEDRTRRLRLVSAAIIVALAGAAVVAMIGDQPNVAWSLVLAALAPPLVLLSSFPVTREDLAPDDSATLVLIFGVLVAPPALLALAKLVG